MIQDIKVPTVGESITEATLAEWQVQDGSFVQRDQVLAVLETDKASVEIVAENTGAIKHLVEEGATVAIGAVVAQLDTAAQNPQAGQEPAAKAAQANTSPPMAATTSSSQSPAAATPSPVVVSPAAGSPTHSMPLSPAVRRMATEAGLNLQNQTGSGKGGRLTKGDLMNLPPAAASPGNQTKPLSRQDRGVERVPMSRLRQTIASRLVQAQQTAAILTTFNEIDMSAVMDLRKKYKDDFKEKYGVGLGFMGFFAKATIQALKAFPQVNGHIDGKDMILNSFVNLGIAVGTDKGLMVPVIRDADLMSIAEIELAIKDFAVKARDNKISLDDLAGGTFTISNGGVYGSLMSTPILNPPQSGILGLHKIEERPIAVNGQVVVRPMMYVALSYDHRMIDGKESVSFLVKIKEGMEDPARLLIEI